MEQNTLAATCFKSGTLTIQGKNAHTVENGFVTDGGLENYSFTTAERLHKVASTYDHVDRGNGKIEPGSEYTLRKARNDFAAFMNEA